jgi:hypothetical protein
MGAQDPRGYVDVYAIDVIVERPEAVLKGRRAVVDWAKHEQDWADPHVGSRLVLHQVTAPAQTDPNLLYETHELRFERQGKPVRQTFSALWRNNNGLWQMTHLRVSEVKPVTGLRPS